MAETRIFWAIECAEGEPEYFVCMSCLNEVYRCKVPSACSTCDAISTFEAFTLSGIRDWGSEGLVTKAEEASADHPIRPPSQPKPHVEDPTLTETPSS